MNDNAALITAAGAVIVSLIGAITTAYLQIKASRTTEKNKNEAIAERAQLQTKVDAVAATVDGHATEQTRQIVALKEAVASQSRGGTIPEQTAGAEGNAPVGTDQGVVTVERREATQRSTDTPAEILVAKDTLHPETDLEVATQVSEGLKNLTPDTDKQ